MGRKKKDEVAAAAVAQRRKLVARPALKRLSGREIAAALAALPDGERPENCSVPTIARDLALLREEWAATRRTLMEELVDDWRDA